MKKSNNDMFESSWRFKIDKPKPVCFSENLVFGQVGYGSTGPGSFWAFNKYVERKGMNRSKSLGIHGVLPLPMWYVENSIQKRYR